MPSLHDAQARFLGDLFEPAGRPDFIDGGEARFAIYRNNLFSNLREVLRAVYPVVEKLVGSDFLHHAATTFIRAHPSTSGDVHEYGREFAEFLDTFPPLHALPYVADVARLEWAMHEAFHAADAPPLASERLGGVPPDRFGALTLALHPACRLLASAYPILRIWEANQPGAADEFVSLTEGGTRLLVRRPRYEVEALALSAGEFSMLGALLTHRTIAQALAHAHDVEPEFDLGAFLAKHFLSGTFVDFGVAAQYGSPDSPAYKET